MYLLHLQQLLTGGFMLVTDLEGVQFAHAYCAAVTGAAVRRGMAPDDGGSDDIDTDAAYAQVVAAAAVLAQPKERAVSDPCLYCGLQVCVLFMYIRYI
jgi:hypothetical protein